MSSDIFKTVTFSCIILCNYGWGKVNWKDITIISLAWFHVKLIIIFFETQRYSLRKRDICKIHTHTQNIFNL